MARSKIPDALRMTTLKYGEAAEEQREAVLAALRAAGRHAEALLLLEGRPDHPVLDEEAAWAVAEGNGFHLMAVGRSGREVREDEWRACGRAAESRGRWLDARHCYLALGDDGALRAIAEHLPESLRLEADAGEAPA